MKGHRDIFNQVAEKHDLPALTGEMSTAVYIGYCFDLMMVEQGRLDPSEIRLPVDVWGIHTLRSPLNKNWLV